MKKLFVILFSLGLLLMISCGDEGDRSTTIELAPGAPEAPIDVPIGWEARNLEITDYVTTSTDIVVWISWEAFGPNGTAPHGTSMSKKIYIDKE